MTIPSNLAEQLARFTGSWIGNDTIYPSRWDPSGGSGLTRYSGAFAMSNLFVVGNDVQERPNQPPYYAHKVFGWDRGTQMYTFHFFDSTGQNPVSPATGVWDGDSIMFNQATPMGHLRYIYTFAASHSYSFQMLMSGDGQDWNKFIEGVYRKTGE